MTNTDTNDANASSANDVADANVEQTPVQKLAAQFEKNKRIVSLSGADHNIFSAFVGEFDEGQVSDWSHEGWENPTYALVGTEENENRLIALPPKDVALADNVVRAKAYDWYIAKAMLAAKKADASKELFATAAGFFIGFDMDAFKFQAENWVTFFQDKKGVKAMNMKTLRQCLMSAIYAKTRFPAAPQSLWEKILGAMSSKAEAGGYNSSIFAHWLGTRAVTEIDLKAFDATDEELEHVFDPAPAPAEAATA